MKNRIIPSNRIRSNLINERTNKLGQHWILFEPWVNLNQSIISLLLGNTHPSSQSQHTRKQTNPKSIDESNCKLVAACTLEHFQLFRSLHVSIHEKPRVHQLTHISLHTCPRPNATTWPVRAGHTRVREKIPTEDPKNGVGSGVKQKNLAYTRKDVDDDNNNDNERENKESLGNKQAGKQTRSTSFILEPAKKKSTYRRRERKRELISLMQACMDLEAQNVWILQSCHLLQTEHRKLLRNHCSQNIVRWTRIWFDEPSWRP